VATESLQLNVSPSLAGKDVADLCLSNSDYIGDPCLRPSLGAKCEYESDFPVCEFCLALPLTASKSLWMQTRAVGIPAWHAIPVQPSTVSITSS
jgi:hypothetical protein